VLVGEEIFSFDINAFLMEQSFLEGIEWNYFLLLGTFYWNKANKCIL